jgi:hypothetical protein
MNDAELAAYHEAGHAVISLTLGIPFKSVMIFPTEDDYSWGGYLTPIRGHRSGPDDTQLVDYAGLLAEGRARGCRYGIWSGKDDIEHAEKMYRAMIPKGAAALLSKEEREKADGVHWEWVEKITKRMVKEHWNEIRAVAEALIDKDLLTMAEVEAIIQAARGPV